MTENTHEELNALYEILAGTADETSASQFISWSVRERHVAGDVKRHRDDD
jgi:hypothetical protein